MPPLPPDDFTIYRECAGLPKALLDSQRTSTVKGKEFGHDLSSKPVPAYSDSVRFLWKTDTEAVLYSARALICQCWATEMLSITLRVEKEQRILVDPVPASDDLPRDGFAWVAPNKDWSSTKITLTELGDYIGAVSPSEVPATSPQTERIAKVNPTVEAVAENEKNPFLFSKRQLTDALFPAIFHPLIERDYKPDGNRKVIRQGLVVISGQTGSLKTEILRELVRSYLESFDLQTWGKAGRHPHVITLEDPIEKPLTPREKFNSTIRCADSREFDFTPRQIGKDVTSLKEGLFHALRQTPAVVIAGETREEDEWKVLLDFAATGHLCLTTAHAGSLVETMRKIVEATKAVTPDLRSSLVEKTLGVVHLQKFSLVMPA